MHDHTALGDDLASQLARQQELTHMEGAVDHGPLADDKRPLAGDFAGKLAVNVDGALKNKLAFIDGIGTEKGVQFFLCHTLPQ